MLVRASVYRTRINVKFPTTKEKTINQLETFLVTLVNIKGLFTMVKKKGGEGKSKAEKEKKLDFDVSVPEELLL